VTEATTTDATAEALSMEELLSPAVPEQFSRSDLSGLSEAEIEALKEPEEVEEPEDDEDDAAEEAQEAAPADPEPEPAGAPQAAPPPTPAALPPAPDFDAEATERRLREIEQEHAALLAQAENGEVETHDFTEKTRALALEAGKLEAKAEMARDYAEREAAMWQVDCETFLNANPDVKANEARLVSFDAVVRRVTADEANRSLSNTAQLDKALTIWREEIGLPAPAPQPSEKPAAKKSAPKKELPPTLGGVPAAAPEDVEGGRFAALDVILETKGDLAFEQAFGKLSAADQEAYLAR
jgi:hypothetical protein